MVLNLGTIPSTLPPVIFVEVVGESRGCIPEALRLWRCPVISEENPNEKADDEGVTDLGGCCCCCCRSPSEKDEDGAAGSFEPEDGPPYEFLADFVTALLGPWFV